MGTAAGFQTNVNDGPEEGMIVSPRDHSWTTAFAGRGESRTAHYRRPTACNMEECRMPLTGGCCATYASVSIGQRLFLNMLTTLGCM